MKACPKHVLDEMVKRIVDALHPVRIYLFGSQADGSPDRHSDVDLLVVVADTPTAPRELARLGRRSLWGLRVPVDLIVCTSSEMRKWSRVSCNVIHTAVQKGKLLYVCGG